MTRWLVAVLFLGCCLSGPSALWAQKKDEKKDDEITLERLFPEKSFFGPRASSMAFSADGNYAAWLYRSWDERRHGSDLWLYEFKSDKLTRVSDVALMSEFQRSARKVRQDRLDKHARAEKEKADKNKDDGKKSDSKGKRKKEGKDGDGETSDEKKGKQEKKKSKKELEEERKIINSVTEEDADDEDAPRYSGISGFEWHPEKNAMLVFSEGEIYQIEDVKKPELKRLTNTLARESQVSYLPRWQRLYLQPGKRDLPRQI